MKNLLALAKSDGTLHPREEKLLFKIGKRYGLKERQIKAIIDSNEASASVIPDNHNDKMNLIYDLLLMIHADGKVDLNEVSFLEDAVKMFGMKKEMVPWLLEIFDGRGTPPPPNDWEDIKKEAAEKFSLA